MATRSLLLVAIASAGSLAGCLDFPPELLESDSAAGDGAGGDGSQPRRDSGPTRDTAARDVAARDTAVDRDKGLPPDSGPSCNTWKRGWSCASGGASCGTRTISCAKPAVVNWECTCVPGSGGSSKCSSFLATQASTACNAAKYALESKGCCKP